MYCLSLLSYKHQVCEFNGCHDFLYRLMGFDYITTVTVGKNDYKIHLGHKSKVDCVSTMKNANFKEKRRHLWKTEKNIFTLL